MKKIYLIILLIGFLLSFFVYYFFKNTLYVSIFLILYIISIMLLLKKIKEKNKFYHRLDNVYHFVNLINIQMLSCNSVYQAYKECETYLDVDFANIANEDLIEELKQLSNDYNITSFKMYISILEIYDKDGGNFKEMESIPTSLCQKSKIYYDKLFSIKQTKLVQITTLYLLFLCLTIFMKISIPSYFELMISDSKFSLILFGVIAMTFVFYSLTISELFKNKIRGL